MRLWKKPTVIQLILTYIILPGNENDFEVIKQLRECI